MEEEQSGDFIPQSVDVASGGDLVLVVGDNKDRIRVHSVILRNASPVFKAMFSRSYIEGAQLASSTIDAPTELALPGDEYEPLLVLCKVVHSRNDDIPGLDPKEIFDVAVLAGKYDCTAATKFVGMSWLSGRLWGRYNYWSMVYFLTAAWMFEQHLAFREITAHMVMYFHEDSYDVPETERFLPAHVFTKIVDTRHRLKFEIASKVMELVPSGITKEDHFGGNICRIACAFPSAMIAELQRQSLYPPPASRVTITTLVKSINDLKLPQGDFRKCEYGYDHEIPLKFEKFVSSVEELKENSGLSLIWFKTVLG